MSKSLDNYIGISESPEVMFEKCMKVPDNLLADYFRLTADIGPEQIHPLLAKDIREAHFLYGETIVTMYHSRSAAAEAKERYLRVAAGKAPESLPEYRLAPETYPLWKLVTLTGLAASSSEARRLISQGGIALDGAICKDPLLEVAGKGELILKRGKSGFAKAIFQ
jgi:tyrosyl-tRNA synthetase